MWLQDGWTSEESSDSRSDKFRLIILMKLLLSRHQCQCLINWDFYSLGPNNLTVVAIILIFNENVRKGSPKGSFKDRPTFDSTYNVLKVSDLSEKSIKHCLAIIFPEFPSKIESF